MRARRSFILRACATSILPSSTFNLQLSLASSSSVVAVAPQLLPRSIYTYLKPPVSGHGDEDYHGSANRTRTESLDERTKNDVKAMEESYNSLISKNQEWVQQQREKDPAVFTRMSSGQNPQVLWIGCSDSRVPANVITGSEPGSIFVHRNIANTVVHTDMNFLSVLQYAVDVLKVKHVIVCGHYGCGGVIASMTNHQYGMVDNWLRNIKDEYLLHRDELENIKDETKRAARMTELHVVEGVYNVCRTSIIKDAWERRKNEIIFPHIHGWVYGLHDGYVRDLNATIRGPEDVPLLVQKPLDVTKLRQGSPY